MVVLSLAALLTAALFALALSRVRRALRSVPEARAGLASAPDGETSPSVCIIVPAHNEEQIVSGIVRSALGQNYPNLAVLFALDRCTDDTRGAIERAAFGDGRIEILEIDSCPDDWAGKPHALRSAVRDGAAPRHADLLLFVDADTRLHPDCVRAAVGLLRERDLDLLSLLSTLAQRSWFERIVQPMTVLELMRQYPLDRINRSNRPSSFANGQFMLFRNEVYDAVGGHERVKEALLEDLAFARAMKKDGRRWGVFIARDMLHCRMYPTWSAFRNGWKRIFIESARRRPTSLRRFARRMLIAHTVLPTLAVAAFLCGLVATIIHPSPSALITLSAGALATSLWVIAMMTICASQGASRFSALTAPAGAILAAGILREAAEDLEHNRGVRWAGRVYTNLTQPAPDPGAPAH